MYVCIYVRMCVCMHTCEYVCMYACAPPPPPPPSTSSSEYSTSFSSSSTSSSSPPSYSIIFLLINLWFPHYNETFNKILYMILLYIIIPCTVTALTRCMIIRAPAGRCKVVHLHPWILLFVFAEPYSVFTHRVWHRDAVSISSTE